MTTTGAGLICEKCGMTKQPATIHPFCNTMGQALFRISLSDEEIEKLNWVAKMMNKTVDEVAEMFVSLHLKNIEIK